MVVPCPGPSGRGRYSSTASTGIVVNRLLEVERTRTAIATDLHDDIGTTLTSIALFSDLAKGEIATNAPQAVERLERIAASSRELLGQMSDIVWAVKPDNDSLQSAILRMADVAGVLCAARGIEHTIHVPDRIDDVHLTMQQRRNILLVFKEMVNNVVKHSRATRVAIDVTLPGSGATPGRVAVFRAGQRRGVRCGRHGEREWVEEYARARRGDRGDPDDPVGPRRRDAYGAVRPREITCVGDTQWTGDLPTFIECATASHDICTDLIHRITRYPFHVNDDLRWPYRGR